MGLKGLHGGSVLLLCAIIELDEVFIGLRQADLNRFL